MFYFNLGREDGLQLHLQSSLYFLLYPSYAVAVLAVVYTNVAGVKVCTKNGHTVTCSNLIVFQRYNFIIAKV